MRDAEGGAVSDEILLGFSRSEKNIINAKYVINPNVSISTSLNRE